MTVTVRDLTAGEVAGSGLYDELMRTTKAHLDTLYNPATPDTNYITQQNYATMYLGAMQANLSEASRFVLSYELTNQQILESQEKVEQAKKQNELLELQKEQLRVQIDTAKYNLDHLMPEQLQQLQEQVDLLQNQDVGQIAQNSLTAKQELLVDKQILTETANTSVPTAGITKAQYDKLQKENELTAQRVISEKAQTQDRADGTTATGGLIGKEMRLKEVQGDSFLRDAEQKAAKFYSDILSIVYSTDPSSTYADPDAWKFGSAESTRVVNQLLTGIGV